MARVCRVLLASLFGLLLVAAPLASAKAEVKVAVVDFQRLMEKSTAAQAAEKRLTKQREDLQTKLKAEEKDLAKKLEELKKDQAKLKPEEFEKKRKEFEQSIIKARETVNKQKSELDSSLATATSNLRGEILKIVADIAAADKYDLVLSSQNVVLAQKEMDITDKVLEKLNSTVKDVPSTPKKK